ncbi:hypothetical protein UlMin_002748 [Ulmus minor]
MEDQPSVHHHHHPLPTQEDSAATSENMAQSDNNIENDRINSELARRWVLQEKYTNLRKLIPNPTETDRAAIVKDAIRYTKELLKTVNELKLIVEKKRCERGQTNKNKPSTSHPEKSGTIGVIKPEQDQLCDHSDPTANKAFLRNKEDTKVEVRIVDDKVLIEIVQKKRNNDVYLLQFGSKLLDQLELDILNITGGCIGDYSSFLFNTKMHEGSSLNANAIANKFIEVLDMNYTSVSPTP